ncbi:putative Nucleolar protein 10 [Hypsibius exemplaris]|uniref:Nucleolar protein 10 n=1 Tax=Hypsibius exemplaris TaxID=2072580 RepID=A0A1W0W9D6_HYPEX|nr:putative Nucleolar protein 10 [Hypsibius exemplaris]
MTTNFDGRRVGRVGLSDLIGTSLLRAYMHGFFVDVRLYRKAKSIVEPFNHQEYRQETVKQKITEKLVAEQTESRVQTIKLPKVNAALARKFLDPTVLQDEKSKRKAKLVSTKPAGGRPLQGALQQSRL